MTATTSLRETDAGLARPATGLAGLVYGAIDTLERVPMSVLTLMARVGIATVFWKSAQTKIASWDQTLLLFENEYPVPLLPPDVAAYMATAVELICPVLLVLGLFTRLATLPMLGMTLVIQIFIYPGSWLDHLMWATLLLLVLTRGPGVFSLDHVIGRRLLGR
jgi:putative oxidoreductase